MAKAHNFEHSFMFICSTCWRKPAKGYKETTHTRMGDGVSLEMVALEKPHITHCASKWLHP